jgi:hypothetical protein
MGKPVTEDPQLMAELVSKYMDEAMPDPELYEFAIARGVEPPADIAERDKRSLFSVRFPPGSDTGALEWDWWEPEAEGA